MRLFLVFIILLNVLYAGWEYLSPAVTDNGIPPLPDNLKTLELLRETKESVEESVDTGSVDSVENDELDGSNNEGMEESQVVVVTQAIEKESQVRSCFTLGPFKDKDIMQQVRLSLSEQVKGMEVRKLRDSEKHRYWVYIPSLGSRKKAKNMVEQLTEKDVKDFYIILNGDTRNGISLGHFKEQFHANRRFRKVKRLGFKAEIKVIYREFDVYWLDYEQKIEASSTPFSIDEYVTEGVSQLERECH